ncbi:MAG: long-chain acyl-CoA synthetase [Acidimicrobiaceae bacterium]|nr:long-chain acyl-CoA synthetase [Acidimicrobiaceae bacterium]
MGGSDRLELPDVERDAARAESTLRRLGAVPGDCVVLAGVPQRVAIAVAAAALRLGVSVLPLPPAGGDRLAGVATQLRPVAVFGGGPVGAEDWALGSPVLPWSVLLENAGAREVVADPVPGSVPAGALLEAARRPGGPGSTTFAAAMSSLASSFLTRYDLPPRGAHVAAVPFWHAEPLRVALGAVNAGHSVVLAAELGREEILRELGLPEAVSLFVVPDVLAALIEGAAPAGPPPGLAAVVVGIRPCPAELRRAAEQRFGPVVYESHTNAGVRCLAAPASGERHRRVGVWRLAAGAGDELAVVEEDGAVLTRRDLVARAWRMALALRTRGLGPGAVVASCLPNGADAIVAYLGAIAAGCGYLAVGTDLPPPRLREVLSAHSPALLVAAGQRVPGLTEASVAELTADIVDAPVDERTQAGFLVALSSGSTGVPKAVRRHAAQVDLTLRALTDASLSRWLEMPTSGPHLVTGPLSGGAFRSVAVAALHSGQSLALMRSWSPERALELVERLGATSMFLLPSMMAGLLRARDAGPHRDVSSLAAVVHAATPCPPELKRRMIEWLGPVVHEFYAAAEASGTFVLARDWLCRPGTVGRASPGVSIRIVGESGDVLPPGDAGRVSVNSGGYSLLGGGGTSAHEGYTEPGDLGYLDDDGFLFLVGRDAEVIKVGGVKVHAREVEQVLCRHPAVIDAAAVGVEHPTLGECVFAWAEVGAVGDAAGVERSVLRAARDVLPVTHAPRRLHVVEALPRTPSGKVDRLALRALYP